MTHYASGGQRTAAPEALSFVQRSWTIVTGVSLPRPQNSLTPSDAGLEYETRRIEMVGGQYLEGWYVPHIETRGIVLMFPGYAASKDSLLAPAKALHEMGYSAFLVDFRGAGGSSGDSTTLGVREAEDVARSVEYARQEWPGRAITLYGVSMGSAAVMRAVAVEGVRPDALILESSFGSLLSTVGNRFHALGLPATPGAELVVFWGSVQNGLNGFAHNPAQYAEQITSPALVMHGDLDPRVSAEETNLIYSHLNGPKEFVSFAGAGHESLYLFAPELWREKVRQFLAR